jgi:hypothetical protein
VVVRPLGQPCNASVGLQFSCVFGPLRRSSSLISVQICERTFQSSTITSSLLLNPVRALTNTGVASIAMPQCLFSDVDPLDGSIAPLGDWVGFGEAAGKYCRGTVVAALVVIVGSGTVLRALVVVVPKLSGRWTESDVESFMRFPSILLVPAGALNQGMVTCSVALIRLQISTMDLVIAAAGLSLALSSVVMLLLAGTKWLRVHKEPRSASELTSKHDLIVAVLKVGVWKEHWVKDNSHDTINLADLEADLLQDEQRVERRPVNAAAGFKKRYQLMLDDMSAPWWLAFEMTTNFAQGAILGLRINDESVCDVQRIMLAALSGFALLVTCIARPCGSYAALVFLIVSKLGAFLAALFVAVGISGSGAAWASAVGENVTAFMGLLSVVAVFAQIAIAFTLERKTILRAVRKLAGWLQPTAVQEPPDRAPAAASVRAAAVAPTTISDDVNASCVVISSISSVDMTTFAATESAAAARPRAVTPPAPPRDSDRDGQDSVLQEPEVATVPIGPTPLESENDLLRAYRRQQRRDAAHRQHASLSHPEAEELLSVFEL